MKIPDHLSHKPVIKVENYDIIDGEYKGISDAKGLSLGISQWNENTLSAKIWRRPNKKWSRQSEELPLHRVLDLTLLILKTKLLLDKNSDDNQILSQGSEKIAIELNKDMNQFNKLFENANLNFLNERVKEISKISSLLISKEEE